MKPLTRRMPKNPKQKLEKELEDLWKAKCVETYPLKCEVCGSREVLSFHHFIPKSRSTALRYDLVNGVCLCHKCHYIVHFSKEPTEIHRVVETIIARRGEKWHNYIESHKRDEVRKNMKWLLEQREILLNL